MRAYKVVAMSLVLVMLVACSPTATPAPASPTQAPSSSEPTKAAPTPAPEAGTSEQPITLNVWLYPYWSGVTGTEDPSTSTPADFMKYVAEEYKKTHPNVSFNFEVLSWSDGRQKVNIAISSKSMPDILANEDGPVLMRYAMMGVLAPIDEYLTAEDREDFSPVVLKSATYNGHVMFWPWGQTGSFWVANRKIFEERGAVDLLPTNPDHSWTYDEFLAAAQATTFSRSGGSEPDVYGVSMGFKEGPGDYNRFGFLWGKGSRFYSDDFTKMTINSPESEAGLQFLHDLEWKYNVMVPGSAGMSDDDASQLFMEGKVAMMGAGNWLSEQQLADEVAAGSVAPDTVEYYGILPPADPGQSPSVDAPVVADAVFIQDDPAKLKAAMEYLHMVSDTKYMGMIKPSGNAAVRKSVGNLYPDSELLTWWQTITKYAAPDMTSPFNKDLRSVTTPMLQEVMTEAKTPAQAMQDAEQNGNQLITSLLSQMKQ